MATLGAVRILNFEDYLYPVNALHLFEDAVKPLCMKLQGGLYLGITWPRIAGVCLEREDPQEMRVLIVPTRAYPSPSPFVHTTCRVQLTSF